MCALELHGTRTRELKSVQTAREIQIRPTRVASSPNRPLRRVLRWTSWALLLIGILSLGYVAFSAIDATLFQSYENWRLNKSLAVSEPSTVVPLKLPLPSSPVN